MLASRSVFRTVPAAAIFAALAGAAASSTGAPLARDIVADADAVELLDSVMSPMWLNLVGSILILDDINNDGVREYLLTHINSAVPFTAPDLFKSSVRCGRTGEVLLELPVDTLTGTPAPSPFHKLGHFSALVIDDIDEDGTPDIATARAFGFGAALRVYSGATGEILRDAFTPGSQSWGLSMLPYEDGTLLLGRLPANIPASHAVWSPRTNALTTFLPANMGQSGGFATGYAMVDLGVRTSGAREILSTRANVGIAAPPGGVANFVRLAPPTLHARYTPDPNSGWNAVSVHAGGVMLGDLDGDGLGEVVLGATLSNGFPFTDPALPVISSKPVGLDPVPQDGYQAPYPLEASFQHRPFFVVPTDSGLTSRFPWNLHAILPIGDATGDGFPDYAIAARVILNDYDDSYGRAFVIAACGRTGQAFFAAGDLSDGTNSQLGFTNPRQIQMSVGRNALVSPGDLNDDGVNDLVVMLYRASDSTEPEQWREQILVTHYLPTPCAGDTNFDRIVNFADLNAVLSNFGVTDITSPADLNADGVVNFADLNLVLSAFGKTCK